MTQLTGFSDSSWKDCPDTGRSTVGYKLFINGGLVEWSSSVPIPVAMSSAEAEYMAACSACMAMTHLRMLIYDLESLGTDTYILNGTNLSVPNLLLIDNEATVAMSKNYKPTKKNRHIAQRFHYVREGQCGEQHHLVWIPAEDQIEDDMTKTEGV